MARQGEADRHVAAAMPKHLNSGKRGMYSDCFKLVKAFQVLIFSRYGKNEQPVECIIIQFVEERILLLTA